MRPALKTGLVLEQDTGVNPYRFGVIGSTDSHTGLASYEENNFWGKFARDSIPEKKRVDDLLGGSGSNGWSMSASGLAAAWAADNTRDAIFDAFQRREVYATSGTRIKVRLFAGWKFNEEDLFAGWKFNEEDLQSGQFAELGYAGGVPMGGVLQRNASDNGSVPMLMIRAEKDPANANLDRIQVIKGWLDASGAEKERIYDVAWSGERVPGPDGALPAIGNTVNLQDGSYSNTIGTPELSALWSDPDFNPGQSAFYYVRVLQIPTPRHSLLDGIALQTDVPREGPATIQERAYTSPVWYVP
jgi:hypothetical protein